MWREKSHSQGTQNGKRTKENEKTQNAKKNSTEKGENVK